MKTKMLVSEIKKAYDTLDVGKASIIYLYSDFRALGAYLNEFDSKDEFLSAFMSPLLKRDITIIIPSFTYTTSGTFNTEATPTKIGTLNQWVLAQPGRQRSEHPLFSYAALGPQADIVLNIGKSAFGNDSVFTRLSGRKAAFLHIGRPVSHGNTTIHHVEQLCGATYRIHMAFQTKVYRGYNYIGTNYTAFLRRRDVPEYTFAFDFSQAAQQLYTAGVIRETGQPDKFTNFSFYGYDEALDFLMKTFFENQNVFIGKPFLQY